MTSQHYKNKAQYSNTFYNRNVVQGYYSWLCPNEVRPRVNLIKLFGINLLTFVCNLDILVQLLLHLKGARTGPSVIIPFRTVKLVCKMFFGVNFQNFIDMKEYAEIESKTKTIPCTDL